MNKIKTGDTVRVIAGKDKGKDGKVLAVKDGKVLFDSKCIVSSSVECVRVYTSEVTYTRQCKT